MLPEQKQSEETKAAKKQNDDVLAVWDLEKKAFRSFKLDSLISVEY